MDGRSWRPKKLLSQVENKIIIKDLQKSSVLDFRPFFLVEFRISYFEPNAYGMQVHKI